VGFTHPRTHARMLRFRYHAMPVSVSYRLELVAVGVRIEMKRATIFLFSFDTRASERASVFRFLCSIVCVECRSCFERECAGSIACSRSRSAPDQTRPDCSTGLRTLPPYSGGHQVSQIASRWPLPPLLPFSHTPFLILLLPPLVTLYNLLTTPSHISRVPPHAPTPPPPP
jgi:hypothetical protein